MWCFTGRPLRRGRRKWDTTRHGVVTPPGLEDTSLFRMRVGVIELEKQQISPCADKTAPLANLNEKLRVDIFKHGVRTRQASFPPVFIKFPPALRNLYGLITDTPST